MMNIEGKEMECMQVENTVQKKKKKKCGFEDCLLLPPICENARAGTKKGNLDAEY